MSTNSPFSRKKSNSQILQTIGSGKRKDTKKSFHAHRGAIGSGKGQGPSSAAQQQQEQQFQTEAEIEKALRDLLLEQGAPSPKQKVQEEKLKTIDKGGIQTDLDFGTRNHRSWKSKVAHESRNSVVKILTQMVGFDWEQPYRRSDDGQAIGSGFFVSSDGLIVTNAHVVEESSKIWVTVPSSGETRYDAEVVGICFDVDLAVIRAKDAPVQKYLEFGDSNQVHYGQEVLTLGYPLGMDSLKLTEGIISGRQEGFFQTDAPLNPGNSGGPMLSEDGKVIGINVAIAERSQNVGFSIPVFQLTQIFDNLKSRPIDKKVLHKPILGAEFSNSSNAMLKWMGCPSESNGVYVRRAYEGYPLYNAGVRDGDILHTFNGFELDHFGMAEVPWSPFARATIESLMDLLVNDSKPEIEFSSPGGVRKKAKVTFEDPNNIGYPILPPIREFHHPFEKIDYEVIAGLVVMELTLNHIQIFHEAPNEVVLKSLTPIAASFQARTEKHLVICNIFLGSELAKLDLFSPGSLIQSINGIPVKTLSEFRDAMLKPTKKGDDFYITITSKENELAVLPLIQIFLEEIELSESYMYQISPLFFKALSLANDAMINYITKNDPKTKARLRLLQKQSKDREELQY